MVWSGDWFEDPGDEEILAIARNEERILITLDKDFGELAIVRGLLQLLPSDLETQSFWDDSGTASRFRSC